MATKRMLQGDFVHVGRILALHCMVPAIFSSVLVATVHSAEESTADSTGQALRVMSFNIRYGTARDGDNAWPHRKQLVIDTIRQCRPAILGIQEALKFQLDELLGAFPHLTQVGVGRDDGDQQGEFSAILYDAQRLVPIDNGTFWFSETPQQPGSTAWRAQLPRICSWLRCRDKLSGEAFYVYNLHWDHMSRLSRINSAKLLAERISERTDTTAPVIVTGDFNADESSEEFQSLIHRANLRDTYRVQHPNADNVGTFNGFRGRSGGPKIDAVLVSEPWQVVDAQIVRSSDDGRYPSDHFPVTATISLTGR